MWRYKFQQLIKCQKQTDFQKAEMCVCVCVCVYNLPMEVKLHLPLCITTLWG
jgi:hypothetical protein